MGKIKVESVNYTILDTKEKITIADSFVVRSNKIGSGNGEAKFYIGNDNEENRDFFGQHGFANRCFLLKKDLLQYLHDCETEYKQPEQLYRDRNAMPELYEERLVLISNLPDVIWFTVSEQTQIAGPRLYVNSKDGGYNLIRELSLPNITYLSAIKLKDPNDGIVYYYRLFVDYFGEVQHPFVVEQEIEKIEEQQISDEEKAKIIKARQGQGKYRHALLEECPICPITLVSDDRLLIASHIKPWVKSDEKEKIDPKNGFMFTPTYDFLFDRGFITFTNDKKIKISPWLSKMTCSRLNIAPNKHYPMLPVEGRESYLDYHRISIFKG